VALARIQALATFDDLTGLLNRRAILERLQNELRRREPRGPMALALIDLDHFKRVNDSHGHAAGDTVLRRFAEIAGAVIRSEDVLGRWGGEEFLLMMPNTTAQQGTICLQRIRNRLRATTIDEVRQGLVIAFSAGIADCRGEEDLDPAIERADRLMYQAKEQGRDRILAERAEAVADCATLSVSEVAAATGSRRLSSPVS
jgi:diguanylate cyclase (GGDEF)-like protein